MFISSSSQCFSFGFGQLMASQTFPCEKTSCFLPGHWICWPPICKTIFLIGSIERCCTIFLWDLGVKYRRSIPHWQYRDHIDGQLTSSQATLLYCDHNVVLQTQKMLKYIKSFNWFAQTPASLLFEISLNWVQFLPALQNSFTTCSLVVENTSRYIGNWTREQLELTAPSFPLPRPVNSTTANIFPRNPPVF